MLTRLKSFIQECIRVFQVTKKPNKDELTIIVKVSAIGILFIGLIGFLTHVAWQLFS